MPRSRAQTYVQVYNQATVALHAIAAARIKDVERVTADAVVRRKELQLELDSLENTVGIRRASVEGKRDREAEIERQRVEQVRPGNFSIPDVVTISVELDGAVRIVNEDVRVATTIPLDRVDGLREWLNRNYGPPSE